jgi:hypothetical protein
MAQQLITTVYAILCVYCMGLLAWSVGRACLAWLPRYPHDPLLHVHVPLCLGLGILSWLMVVLGLCRILTGWSILVVLLSVAILCRTYMRAAWMATHRLARGSWPTWQGTERYIVWICIIYFVLHGLGALAPVTFWDSTVYHMGIPQTFVQQGHVYGAGQTAFVHHPLLMQMLYTIPLAGGQTVVPPLINLSICLLTCVLIYQVGTRWFHRHVGLWAVALFCCTPLVNMTAQAAFVDQALAYTCGVTLWLWIRWVRQPQQHVLILCALCAGVMMGVKITGVIFACTMGLWGVLLLRTAHLRRTRIIGLCAWTAICLGLAALWPLYSWFTTGVLFGLRDFQDVYTASVAMRPDLLWPATWGQLWALRTYAWEAMGHIMRVTLWPLGPMEWQMSPGPWPLLLLGWLWVLPRIDRRIWQLLGYGIITAAGMHAAHIDSNRFLTPLYPWMALIAAYLLTRLRASHQLRSVALISARLMLVALLCNLALFTAQQAKRIPAALGIQSARTFLAQRIEAYPVMEWSNTHVPGDARILSMDARVFYLRRPYVMGDPSYQRWLRLEEIHSPEQLLRELQQSGITHVLLTRSRTFGIAPMGMWAIFREHWDRIIAHGWAHRLYVHQSSALYAVEYPAGL